MTAGSWLLLTERKEFATRDFIPPRIVFPIGRLGRDSNPTVGDCFLASVRVHRLTRTGLFSLRPILNRQTWHGREITVFADEGAIRQTERDGGDLHVNLPDRTPHTA